MPGGRLTPQERQQIALGLADGLAYAEIARRLDRPTSTVTREVMRNGGAAGYRADLAHHATEHRARRRRQATPRGPDALPQAHGRDARAVQDYEETLTGVFIRSGMPKMPARVIACLYITDSGSLTAAELVTRLRVSPASISKAITFLEGQGLVRRERDERRRERYLIGDDVWYEATVASARALDRVIEASRQGVGILGAGTPAATRLENIARFLAFVSESTLRAAEQVRDVLYTAPAPPGPPSSAAPPPPSGPPSSAAPPPPPGPPSSSARPVDGGSSERGQAADGSSKRGQAADGSSKRGQAAGGSSERGQVAGGEGDGPGRH